MSELYRCKGKVVRLVHLYSFKFGEHFQAYVEVFFQKIWGMIEGNEVKPGKQTDKLVQEVLRYLSEMVANAALNNFFKTNMIILFQKIILPNICLTQDDIEEYDGEPEMYIKNDLEESDSETRKRQCMKFVQILSRKFPQEMNGLIGDSVGLMLQEYQANRQKEWIKKTSVLNLIITASIS
mmetsp:Transcript_31763/g.31041  ORF Transcript_31763/g.31041 Transcript_31763/m.31041 type:complete len:181 (-) Transcript_31763:1676-2218(-)